MDSKESCSRLLLEQQYYIIYIDMDRKYSTNFRLGRYQYMNDLKDNRFKYEKDGVLPLVLPNVLFRGNSVLTSYLQLIDSMFVNMMKTIEKIKNWKCITSY